MTSFSYRGSPRRTRRSCPWSCDHVPCTCLPRVGAPGHQMCRTRDRTADRVRGIKQREFALLSECAIQTDLSHCFQSARITRRHVSWLEQTRISHCSECAEKASSICAWMTKQHNQHRRLATETQDKMSHVFDNSTGPKRDKPNMSQVVNAGSQANKEKSKYMGSINSHWRVAKAT